MGQFSNRVVASGRALLNRLLPDVYIYTDHYSGKAKRLKLLGLEDGLAIVGMVHGACGVTSRCGTHRRGGRAVPWLWHDATGRVHHRCVDSLPSAHDP